MHLLLAWPCPHILCIYTFILYTYNCVVTFICIIVLYKCWKTNMLPFQIFFFTSTLELFLLEDTEGELCQNVWYVRNSSKTRSWINKQTYNYSRMVGTMHTRESEMKRAAAALRWSSLWATPHSLLTSHGQYIEIQNEHSCTKTHLNKTF